MESLLWLFVVASWKLSFGRLIQVTNKCQKDVFLGLSGRGLPTLNENQLKLGRNDVISIHTSESVEGRLWGRTGCGEKVETFTTTDCLTLKHPPLPQSPPPCYGQGEWFYCYDSTSKIVNQCWKTTNKELTRNKVSQCNSWCVLTVDQKGKNIPTTDFTWKYWGCDTGDCGDRVCKTDNLNTPATLFEFTLGDPHHKDNYDISVIEGFNLKMEVNTSSKNCPPIGCAMETSECQKELKDVDFCWSIKQVLDHSPPTVLKNYSPFQQWTKKTLDAGEGSKCTINAQNDQNFCYYLLTCNCGKVKGCQGDIETCGCTAKNKCGCTTKAMADKIGGVCCTPNKNDYHWLEGKDADKVCHVEYWPKAQDGNSWIKKFKEKCPQVYAWQYDDTATKSCPSTDQAYYVKISD